MVMCTGTKTKGLLQKAKVMMRQPEILPVEIERTDYAINVRLAFAFFIGCCTWDFVFEKKSKYSSSKKYRHKAKWISQKQNTPIRVFCLTKNKLTRIIAP
jgi:hypothetical protein